MDQESFLFHLEELRKVLWKCITIIAVAIIPGLLLAPKILEWLIAYACPKEMTMHYFSPLEPLMVQLNLGFVLALGVTFPFIIMQLAKFVAPGLYPKERRWAIGLVIASLTFFILGASLGVFLVLPLLMKFSASFTNDGLTATIGLGSFLKTTSFMILGFGSAFQLPVIVIILVKTGIVKVKTLKIFRPYILIGVSVLSAILTPPDVISMLVMTIPSCLLFECALWFASKIAPEENDESTEDITGHPQEYGLNDE